MKGCRHDHTLMEDECDCIVAHTNNAEAALPHDSLVQYIEELHNKLNCAYVLADEARGHVGQLDHTFEQAQKTNEDCELCQARSKLDELRQMANPIVR